PVGKNHQVSVSFLCSRRGLQIGPILGRTVPIGAGVIHRDFAPRQESRTYLRVQTAAKKPSVPCRWGHSLSHSPSGPLQSPAAFATFSCWSSSRTGTRRQSGCAWPKAAATSSFSRGSTLQVA